MRIEEASRILLICREQLSPADHSLRIGEVHIREEVTQKASWQIIEKSSVPESAAFSKDRSLDARLYPTQSISWTFRSIAKGKPMRIVVL
jgi:hypothetical protein